MAIRPHAFVAMPFGTKPGPDGQSVDFNRVYTEYIAPALEAAGLTAFRADEEIRGGDIRTDMFQELLIADLVIADLSIPNPNVWYELGVRHALRARGVVLVSAGGAPAAFDVYTDRKLRYSLKEGAPDAATLEADKASLTAMIKATMESWHGRKVSPVYSLMPNLKEPDWKSLRVGDVKEFWEQYDAWQRRMDLARRANNIGDVLVLADEAPVAAFRAEAWIKAGETLRRAEHFGLALEYLERGLEIEPEHLGALREKGMCLQRLALSGRAGHSTDRARDHYRAVLVDHDKDPETWALLGRVDKDDWTRSWRVPAGPSADAMRDEAAYEEARLRAAVDSYTRAYRTNPSHYFSGINALTLMHLHGHLTHEPLYDRDLPIMSGAVRFAAENDNSDPQRYWAKATLGDLEVLQGTPATVTKAYREAIATNEHDWFALNSTREQLRMLHDLGFRPDTVAAGLATFDRALERLAPPEARWEPRKVLLFSGHMIDTPARKEARFPNDTAPAAAKRIAEELDRLDANNQDLAFSQAAAGGDLLFLEACLARGVRCKVLLPLSEPDFIEQSIMPSVDGARWRDRFYAVKEQVNEQAKNALRFMPDALGPAPKGSNVFERCNLWLLYSALACGIDKVRFLTLWNGGGGDGTGGTAFMYKEVKRRTGQVTWVDTRGLT